MLWSRDRDGYPVKLSPGRRNMTETASCTGRRSDLFPDADAALLEVRKLISTTRSVQLNPCIPLLVSCSSHLLLVAYPENTQQRSCRPKPQPPTPATPPSRCELSPNTTPLLSILIMNRTRRSPRLCALPTLLLPEVYRITQPFPTLSLTLLSRLRCHSYRKLAAD